MVELLQPFDGTWIMGLFILFGILMIVAAIGVIIAFFVGIALLIANILFLAEGGTQEEFDEAIVKKFNLKRDEGKRK